MAIRIAPTAYSNSITNPFDWKDELNEHGKMLAYIKSYKDSGYSLYGLSELEKSNINHKTNLLTNGMHTEDPKVLSEKIRFHYKVLSHLDTMTEWQEEPKSERMTFHSAITKFNMIPINAITYSGNYVYKLWKNTNFSEWFKNKKSELKRKGFI
jgi:hypothetical protein